MNRNDFYKELMTQYALDPEKIRTNALKQAKKPAWQTIAGNYWKPALGAAAAVAVAVGISSYANQPAPDITVEPSAVLSASQRLMEAEQNYYNSINKEYFSDVYITFTEAVSYDEILMSLSTVADPGEFRICSLYLEDDILTGSEIEDYTDVFADAEAIIAVKVSLPVSYYRDLQDLSIVYLAELGSREINDGTFTPMVVEDGDPLYNVTPVITTEVTERPVITTTPFSFEITKPVDNRPVIGESVDNDTVTTLPPETSEESAELPEEEESIYETDESGNIIPVEDETEPEEEIIEVSEETEITSAVPVTVPEETTTTYYRGDVSLLTQIYELNVQNALEAHVADNNVVVLTKNEAFLYTLSGFTVSHSSEVISISSPRIAYKGEDCIILTGCRADGTRGMISVIDLETDTVYTYDAGANIGDCEIGGINCSKEDGKYFLKAVSAESTLIYELNVMGGISFRPLVEIEAPVSLAGYNNNLLYFTFVENNAITRLYSFNCTDGTMLEISAFTDRAKLKRGADFRSFAVVLPSEGNSYVLDVLTGMLVPVEYDENISVITDNGETFYHTLSGTFRLDGSGAASAADRNVTFETVESQLFIINEINPEKVVVILNDGSTW